MSISSEVNNKLNSCSGSHLTVNNNGPYLDWQQRPSELKQIISTSFECLAKKTKGTWGHNGAYTYKICQINEAKLLEKIFKEAPSEQKEFNIMDIGAGDFEWGITRAEEIDALDNLAEDVKVNIFGLRGERNTDAEIIETKRCKVHNFGTFKIEDITEQLQNKKLSLENKVDFAVTAMTLCHLADSVGTFDQIWKLIRPQGLLLMDGFYFTYKQQSCSDVNYDPNGNMVKLLLDTKAPFLMNSMKDTHRSLNHFVLKKLDATSCHLPMNYLGIERNDRWNNNSCRKITQFTRESPLEDNIHLSYGKESDCLYGDKNLYDFLSSKDLFHDDILMKWKPFG